MTDKKNKLNKFEETRLFSARAQEIANGAIPKIDVKKIGLDEDKILSKDYTKIAREEYIQGKLDLEILKDN